MLISNNVVAGLKLEGTRNRDKSEMKFEKHLKLTHLLDELKDNLENSGAIEIAEKVHSM